MLASNLYANTLKLIASCACSWTCVKTEKCGAEEKKVEH